MSAGDLRKASMVFIVVLGLCACGDEDAAPPPMVDATTGRDASAIDASGGGMDAGRSMDAGGGTDAGVEEDSGTNADGATVDTGTGVDATTGPDAGGDCRDPMQCGSSMSEDFCTNCYDNGGEVKPGEAGCWCEPRGIYINAWFGECPGARPICP